MPLNRDFIGREYASDQTYEVSREMIRKFADAIGDSNPAYRDPEAASSFWMTTTSASKPRSL